MTFGVDVGVDVGVVDGVAVGAVVFLLVSSLSFKNKNKDKETTNKIRIRRTLGFMYTILLFFYNFNSLYKIMNNCQNYFHI